jgi:hypothetical protein
MSSYEITARSDISLLALPGSGTLTRLRARMYWIPRIMPHRYINEPPIKTVEKMLPLIKKLSEFSTYVCTESVKAVNF